MTSLNPLLLARNKKERKPSNSTFPPPFCKSHVREIPWEADLHAMESRAGTVRLTLSGILPTQGPSVSHDLPCSLQARKLTPAGCPGTGVQWEKSLLPWPQLAHPQVSWVTNPSHPHWQANFHPYHSRSMMLQPTVSSSPSWRPMGSWIKAGQEVKRSLEHLCKANWIHLWPPLLPKWHRNESYRRGYLNSQFFFLFRSLRE